MPYPYPTNKIYICHSSTVAKQQKINNMGQDAFKKFINPKKNSVVKEEIRQDKKKARKEKREYLDRKSVV